MDQIEWEPILWVAGGVFFFFFSVITALISWIAFMFRAEKSAAKESIDAMVSRTDKHEMWIIENNKKTNEMIAQNSEMIAQNTTSIEFLKEMVSKK